MRFLVIVLLLIGCGSGPVIGPKKPEGPVVPPDTTGMTIECRECRDDCLEAFPPSRDPVGFQDCYEVCKEGPCGS